MTSVLFDPRPWPRRRWWLWTALIMAGQVGAIVWLGDRAPIRARPPTAAPRLQLAGDASAELFALNDPTLFALPHWQGFSGPAWLDNRTNQVEPLENPEAPHWLPLPIATLGAALNALTQSTDSVPEVALAKTKLTLPEPPPLATASDVSYCVLDGALAGRRLVAPLEPPSWTNADILTNSIVQLAVDTAGRAVSAVLLSGSGNRVADDEALAQARAARFEDLRGTGRGRTVTAHADVTWGKMIFEWRTLPIATTNGAAAK